MVDADAVAEEWRVSEQLLLTNLHPAQPTRLLLPNSYLPKNSPLKRAVSFLNKGFIFPN
jgi:hypothetical protein